MMKWEVNSKRYYRVGVLDNPNHEIAELEAPLREFKKVFDDREAAYTRIRPWYENNYRRWELTPWSSTRVRHWIQDFAVAHAQQDLRRATMVQTSVIDYANYALANPPWPKGTMPDGENYPASWIWLSLGMTMGASLPRIRKYRDLPKDSIIKFYPSAAANAAHPQGSTPSHRLLSHLPTWRASHTISGNHTIDHTKRNWVAAANASFSLYGIHHNYPYPGEWADAIWNALTWIEQFRAIPANEELWAPWNFVSPPYTGFTNWRQVQPNGLEGEYGDKQRIACFEQAFHPSPEVTVTHPATRLPHTTPNNALAAPFVPATRSRKKSPFLRHHYYTIAEVADNGWIIDPNPKDGTVDAFDIDGKHLYTVSLKCRAGMLTIYHSTVGCVWR